MIIKNGNIIKVIFCHFSTGSQFFLLPTMICTKYTLTGTRIMKNEAKIMMNDGDIVTMYEQTSKHDLTTDYYML